MAILLLSLIGFHWVPSISNSKSSAEHPERTSNSDSLGFISCIIFGDADFLVNLMRFIICLFDEDFWLDFYHPCP